MSANLLKATIIATAAGAALLAPQANAEEHIEAGQLTCGVKGGVSFIFGSTKELRCVFRERPGDEGERYEGSIRKFGLDIGVTGNAILTWTVLAPTRHLEAGALAGAYAGVAADASAGIGGGANVLIGGSNRTISLQPLSLQGQTGLNAAVAIAEIQLRPYREGK